MSESQRVIAGRYQVGVLIGRGGMADVYEGLDTRLGRTVAIKLLKSDLANDPSFEARFRQEAQASARMAHPTIVRVYDAGEEVGVDSNGNETKTPFIIMEYVRGTLLRDLLHERRLTIEESVAYAEGVLTALEFSHHAGVVHRDIKAANIMITEGGAVKVMDFGIARAISESTVTQAHTSGIVGTAQYFSPEQARGEAVDARTDLYSTGVLLYEMLAGRPPFQGETAVSVAYQHVSEAVTPPSQHNPEISPAIDAVVLRGLAKNREDRFQTAEDFREHLIAALHAEPEQPTAAPLQETEAPTTEPGEAATVPFVTGLDEFDALLAAGAGEATNAIVQPVEEPEQVAAPVEPVAEVAAPAATWTLDSETDLTPGEPTQAFDEVQYFFDTAPTKTAAEGKSDLADDVDPFAKLGIRADAAADTTSQAEQFDGVAKREKGPSPQLLVGLGAAAAVVIIGMIIWLIGLGRVQVNVSPSVQGISVASVVNDTYTAGYAALTGQQLLVDKVYEQSETVPAESITRTDPPAGTIVNPNTTITVYVSSGPSAIAVPSLLNMTQQDATAALTAAGLVVGTVTEANNATVAKGLVVETLPAANEQVAKGSAVNLVVSNGLVNVPDVRNLEITEAESQLTAVDVGLNVSVITDADPCAGTAGTTVLDQSILPGTAPQGSEITLTVACNP